MDSSFPELQPYIVPNVCPTGRELGRGAYGVVEVVEIPGGTTCAAKKLHDALLQFGSRGGIQKLTNRFVEECHLTSSLRHPHIVQFLGVCFLPGSQLPALLMEQLLCSLDDLLEKDVQIPLSIKTSILSDVASGIAYLHERKPPIIHRDLTAKNVLLNSAMVAKISDLGVARIIDIHPGQLGATLTRAPGTGVYMPPEVLDLNPKYGTKLDIFSFGNLSMYTLTRKFPELAASTYVGSDGKLVARTEVERRMKYILQLREKFGIENPLVQMTEQCLHNNPEERPTIKELQQKLKEAMATVPDQYGQMTKLEMIQLLGELQQQTKEKAERLQSQANKVHYNEEKIQALEKKLEMQGQEKDSEAKIREQAELINKLQTQLQEKEQHRSEVIGELTSVLHRLQAQPSGNLDVGIAETDVGFGFSFTPTPTKGEPVMTAPVHRKTPTGTPDSKHRKSFSLKWKRCKDMDFAMTNSQAIIMNGRVYVGGGFSETDDGKNMVQEYNPNKEEWSQLPKCPMKYFAMAAVKDQLFLAGGRDTNSYDTNEITVWESNSQQWVHPYPPMPTARQKATALGYEHYLIVIGGRSHDDTLDTVEILDSRSQTFQWHTADSFPVPCHKLTFAVLHDTLYMLGGAIGRQAFSVSLPGLISRATCVQTPTLTRPQLSSSPWVKLPDLPLMDSTAVTLCDYIVAVGGKEGKRRSSTMYLYDAESAEWVKVGNLPVARSSCIATILPSGEILVLGGEDESYKRFNQGYIATVDCML